MVYIYILIREITHTHDYITGLWNRYIILDILILVPIELERVLEGDLVLVHNTCGPNDTFSPVGNINRY